ncbi:Drug/metabolite transporter [Lasiodiplodia theobromae]|uniref:Drug/metabolite transporter n=1 Tax=Lasiodiplodia theobromae TaxID=45133 RepID=UPI0015C31DF1|nr:Drug/metabolite transporter [Lasiodiplodia theobromae]KAF4537517.1 Drug/metabolite transporter [Lasiodiplodia theobromae]KAF9639515.1 Drug/metabolite transporter [Lasiodiplodia theobromae]
MSATTQDTTREIASGREQERRKQRLDDDEKAPDTAFQRWWVRNRAWVLVLTAESFGACMGATARLLEDDEKGAAMHPMQIIFVRMALTGILSTIYMRATNVPDFPWGPPGVRGWLLLRGLTGFFGLSAFYWALQYLPLAETTVITFLTPMMVPWAGALLFHEPLAKKVVFAGLVSFAGVIIIARPPWLFPNDQHHNEEEDGSPSASAAMRTLAVTLLLIGAVTATVSYTIIRGIGHRAHALISVNYYSLVSTVGAALFLLFAPGVDFRLPADGRQWALLSVIGFSGFFLQFLLTAGLQHDKSALATTMMYSQVLYALVFDKLIWGNVPAATSWCGGAIVLASTVYVALWGSAGGSGSAKEGKESDEEQGLLAGHRREGDETTDVEGANLVNE